MTTLKLNRLTEQSDYFGPQDSTCSGCAGCGTRSRRVRLSQVKGDSAMIELPLGVQWSMLWNSWLKPLVAMIIAAILGLGFGLDDLSSLCLVVVASLTGYLFCSEAPQKAINISENLS